MTACLHCVAIGKIDKLKPLTPVAAILFLLAGHHQVARASLSVAIAALCGPAQAFNHNAMLSKRNMPKRQRRPKRKNPARIKVDFSLIGYPRHPICTLKIYDKTFSHQRHRREALPSVGYQRQRPPFSLQNPHWQSLIRQNNAFRLTRCPAKTQRFSPSSQLRRSAANLAPSLRENQPRRRPVKDG